MGRRSAKRRLAAVALFAGLALFALARVLHPAPRRATSRPPARAPSQKLAALATALADWTAGRMPPPLLAAAAAATSRDCAEVVIASAGDAGVVDVGANKGWPVTKLGLAKGVSFVVSVEPDERNFGVLRKLPNKHGASYFAVKGAAGRQGSVQTMSFNRDRDDHSCFNCLNTSRPEVYTEDVSVYTIDGLLGTHSGLVWPAALRGRRVALLKTDTQGYEAAVLSGASASFQAGRVANVIMEYDAKLFRQKEVAREALDVMFSAGMECAALAFAGGEKARDVPAFRKSITRATADEFWEFVVQQGGPYTDLFCSKRGGDGLHME